MGYKGRKRCFGAFHCPDCNRRWMSAYSWANTKQECMKCRKAVLPYCQKPLKKPDGLNVINKDKVHQSDLCGKCKQLGHSCTNNRKKSIIYS